MDASLLKTNELSHKSGHSIQIAFTQIIDNFFYFFISGR